MLHEKTAGFVRVGNVGGADTGDTVGINCAYDSANALEGELKIFRLRRWGSKKAPLGEARLDRNDFNLYAGDRGGKSSAFQVKPNQIEEQIFVLRGRGHFPGVRELVVLFRGSAIFVALRGDAASCVCTRRILEMPNLEL